MRYDAAIIGGGANGLTAAALLTRAGLKTVLVERALQPGGRLVTEAFHPGYCASAFSERVPEIPAELAEALGLDTALTVESLPDEIRRRRDGALAMILAEARRPRGRGWLARLRARMAPVIPPAAWPGHDLTERALADWPALTAWALLGRVTDPQLSGSALTLLALAGAEPLRGGLSALGRAFVEAARGTEMRLGVEASEVTLRRDRLGARASGLILSNGGVIEADAVISTLDLPRSVLCLFPWAALPPAMTAEASRFRTPGGTARLLLALKSDLGARAPLLVPGDREARGAFRRGVIPAKPPLLIDPVSARDPSLAPAGGATLAVTISGIPFQLFDGAWTLEKRLRLAASVLGRVERALPGTLDALCGLRIIAPPDIEARLGASSGDLDGGQLTPDQMLALRPAARTQLGGFYLGGASAAAGPLGTGAAGYAAALALLADSGRLP